MIGLSIGLGLSPTPVRSSGGGGLGPEQLGDGDFATDPGPWQLADGDNPATISGGKLRGSASGPSLAYQSTVITTTGLLHVVYTIDPLSAGSVTASTSSATGATNSAPGTYAEDIACAVGDDFSLNMTDAAIIDDVSGKAVL